MSEKEYKMERSFVEGRTFAEADDHITYWADKTPLERLNAACFIINNIYNVTPQTKMNKTLVVPRKHSDGEPL